jgi:replicative DNA helicase
MTDIDVPLAAGRTRVRSALVALAELHAPAQLASRRRVFPTGFDTLDVALSGGIRTGELVLLGGKPGVGKTIAAMQWARSMARAGVVAVFVSLQHDELALLTRLLSAELGALLAASPGGASEWPEELRARIEDVAAGAMTLGAAVDSDPLLAEAHRRLAADADRLVLATGSGARADAASIAAVARQFEGESVAVFVDYVQRVPADRQQIGVIEDLKQLAVEQQLAIVAVAAADHAGLAAPRLHSTHLRGSTALAYEPDAIVVLNDAPPSVALAAGRRTSVVFSIEKNRHGHAGVDLAFAKDFAHFRFHPGGRRISAGRWVEEPTAS